MSAELTETQRKYWDARYLAEGSIWGDRPSETAALALRHFKKHNVRSVLVPGSGYGRNTKVFSEAGLQVVGIEISEVAVNCARQYDPRTDSRLGSALDMSADTGIYDAVYALNILHLFRRKQRVEFLRCCRDRLTENGFFFVAVFSDAEESCGCGKEVEPGTFESKPGRPVHYFTDEDLREHLTGFELLETGSVEDREEHGQGPHGHFLRYALGRKMEKAVSRQPSAVSN